MTGKTWWASAAALIMAAALAGCETAADNYIALVSQAGQKDTPQDALDAYYATYDDADLPYAGPGVSLPPHGSVLTSIAFGSCHKETQPLPILRSVIEARPQLFLYLGDNVYGDAYSGDMSLRELRQSYKDLAVNEDFAALRSAVPMLATWDDHDFGLNDAGGDFSAKRFAERIFERFWGAENAEGMKDHEGVYQARMFGPEGQRVQIIMLDTRFFRSPLKPTDERGAKGKERYVPDPDTGKTLLGAAQWEWLEKELRKPADLRLLVSSIQVHADGHGWESWNKLPAERERLYGLIADTGADNVVMLSGDRHVAGLYKRSDAGYPIHEITSSSLNLSFNDNPDEAGPHRIGSLYGPENFGMVRIDWANQRVMLEVRGEDGRVVRAQSVDLR